MIDNLLEINGVKVPKLINYKVGYKKLWSSDTGRSMTGENKGTLIGIFPKLEIKLGVLTEYEMSLLLSLVNVASADVRYYDNEYRQVITASFYFGDVDVELLRKSQMNYKPIEFSIIANKRRERP